MVQSPALTLALGSGELSSAPQPVSPCATGTITEQVLPGTTPCTGVLIRACRHDRVVNHDLITWPAQGRLLYGRGLGLPGRWQGCPRTDSSPELPSQAPFPRAPLNSELSLTDRRSRKPPDQCRRGLFMDILLPAVCLGGSQTPCKSELRYQPIQGACADYCHHLLPDPVGPGRDRVHSPFPKTGSSL